MQVLKIKKAMNQSMRKFSFFIFALFCVGAFALGFHAEGSLKKQCSLTAELSQNNFSGSLLSQIQNSPQLVCALQLLSFKQKVNLLSCQKAWISLLYFVGLDHSIFLVSSHYIPRQHGSYQFSRLNVLSSQHHPPTLIKS